MVVLVLTAVPIRLRGELSRWMLECDAGVFVGRPTARVREKLWVRVEELLKGGTALMAWTTRSEQGFSVRVAGDPVRVPVDFEGLTLMRQRTDRSDAPKVTRRKSG